MTLSMTMPPLQKASLQALFSLGLVVVALSGIRTYWLYQVGVSTDVTKAIFFVFVYSHAEITLGITCASLPSLRVLFREYVSGSSSLGRRMSRFKVSFLSSRSSGRREGSGRGHQESMAERGAIQRLGSFGDEVPLDTLQSKTSRADSAFYRAGKQPQTNTKQLSRDPGLTALPIRSPEDYEKLNERAVEEFRQFESRRTSGRKGSQASARALPPWEDVEPGQRLHSHR